MPGRTQESKQSPGAPPIAEMTSFQKNVAGFPPDDLRRFMSDQVISTTIKKDIIDTATMLGDLYERVGHEPEGSHARAYRQNLAEAIEEIFSETAKAGPGTAFRNRLTAEAFAVVERIAIISKESEWNEPYTTSLYHSAAQLINNRAVYIMTANIFGQESAIPMRTHINEAYIRTAVPIEHFPNI